MREPAREPQRSAEEGGTTRHLEKETPLRTEEEGPLKNHGDALADGSGSRQGPPPAPRDPEGGGMRSATERGPND